MQSQITTNQAGYVEFANRNFSFNGDRGTWARVDSRNNTLTISIARRGTISSTYMDELRKFGSQYGIDVDRISCGDRVTVEL